MARWAFRSKLNTMLTQNSLARFAAEMLASGPLKKEVTPRRVRVLYNHVIIADTTGANFVWEHPHFPQYYLPTDTVKPGLLKKGKPVEGDGSACLATLEVGSRATDRVIVFEKGPLAGLVRFEFGAMGECCTERKFAQSLRLVTKTTRCRRRLVRGGPRNIPSSQGSVGCQGDYLVIPVGVQ